MSKRKIPVEETATPDETVWAVLSQIDVSKHVEKKNGLSYLPWAWAWHTLKDNYPDSTFIKHQCEETSLPFFSDPETRNAYVKVSVTVEGQMITEVFPVLNYKNAAIENPSAFEVYAAQQRCLAKCIAYHGLGAYLYAGEDLPAGPKVAMVETQEAKGVEAIALALIEFLPSQKDVEKLTAFWTRNKAAIDILKREDQHKYEEVLAKFKVRKSELTVKES